MTHPPIDSSFTSPFIGWDVTHQPNSERNSRIRLRSPSASEYIAMGDTGILDRMWTLVPADEGHDSY